MNKLNALRNSLAVLILFRTLSISAWDYEGHRLVNQLALASLPSDFPQFSRGAPAQERIAFLAGEPDRWRSTPDLPLRHANGPDHYFDLEDLAHARLEPGALSHFRYEFAAQYAAARAAHPAEFAPIDPTRNTDHTREWIGFLPWTITEDYARLKSAFSYLKAFEQYGTPEEVTNAQQNVLYCMGVMGHFVGDAGQPLHTTIHYNGWVGANPRGYTTNRTFHSWIDGGYLQKTAINLAELQIKIHTAQLVWPGDSKARHEDVFPVILAFLKQQQALVETLYQLEKDGRLTGEGEDGLKGRGFIGAQLVAAGQLLGNLWYSAWRQAPLDNYLISQLRNRESNSQPAVAKP